MLAYNYDENNEFIGCETLQKDPLEQGKWLIPANSTLVAPPQYNPKQQKCIFDGQKWQIANLPPQTPQPENKPAPEILCRRQRDMLLYATDKFMLADYPLTAEVRQNYINYRQYLRDIPENPDFPHITIQTFEQWKGA